MEFEKPFTIRRLARVGSSYCSAPPVILCEWTKLKVQNVSVFVARGEQLLNVTGCPVSNDAHEHCKGHHIMNPDRDVYMIPHGFASGDELKYSDTAAMNRAIYEGNKSANDVMKYCYDRIRGKNGILRKSCNSTRPTNTMRFVASPSNGPMDTIYAPRRLFDNGKFLFLNRDGTYQSSKIVDGDVVLLGRCPSQGAESALPMKIRVCDDDAFSVRVPLETCSMNNTDFDGDEVWLSKPMSEDAHVEVTEGIDRVWNSNNVVSIKDRMNALVCEAGGRTDIDSVVYTTMPLEDMLDHPGGEMYKTMMLKARSWKVMGQTTFNPSYWSTCVERSMAGIVNSTLGKHGIGKPYMYMRSGMMMGTCVIRDERHIRISTQNVTWIPAMIAPAKMNQGTCSSGLAKMTSMMYQKGIDMSKHGTNANKTMAVETLMIATDECYAVVEKEGTMSIALIKVLDARMSPQPYTKMDYIAGADTPEDTIKRSIEVVSMVEDIDRIKLTMEERLAVSIFFAFACRYVNEIVSDDMFSIVKELRLDWYTSIMCTNISWLKTSTGSLNANGSMQLTTDITSLLGSIFLGNMSIFAPFGKTAYADVSLV